MQLIHDGRTERTENKNKYHSYYNCRRRCSCSGSSVAVTVAVAVTTVLSFRILTVPVPVTTPRPFVVRRLPRSSLLCRLETYFLNL